MGTPGRTSSQQPASSIKSVALPVARCLPETAQTISHIVRTPPNDTINHAGYARRHITLRPERTSRRRARPTPYTFTFTFTFVLMPHVQYTLRARFRARHPGAIAIREYESKST